MVFWLPPRLVIAALAGDFPELWLHSEEVRVGVLFTPPTTKKHIGYSFLSAVCLKCRNGIFPNIGILEIFRGATCK